MNGDILQAFYHLWDAVAPGGLYFIEDLAAGRFVKHIQPGPVVIDVLQSWIEQKVMMLSTSPAGPQTARYASKYPLPANVAFIFCQDNACVLGKDAAGGAARHVKQGGAGCSSTVRAAQHELKAAKRGMRASKRPYD